MVLVQKKAVAKNSVTAFYKFIANVKP